MGEHAASAAAGDCDSGSVAGNGGTATVKEWLAGLPSNEELMPLSQSLIPPRLAAAFSIKIEPPRTMLDVQRASQDFLASLRRQFSSSSSSSPLKGFPSFAAVEGDESAAKDGSGESSRRTRHLDAAEESDSALRTENSNDESSGRAQKRPRLVWTPQLHKRFVDVVAHLGIKNAVPKTIMQLMNVEGLTRENVASHLQKYRLYLKRMQGISIEGPSSSEHLFVTSPVPPSLHEAPVASPMPYAPPPTLIQMPVIGMTHHGHGAPMAMGPLSGQLSGGAFRGFEAHHPYAMFGDRPKDSWPGGPR